MTIQRLLRALTILATTLWGGAVVAQDTFPSRPLRLVVPFEAGGGSDVGARLFAERWSKELGQPVVVDNRTGAAGAIGANAVAKSAPDGYTICWCTNSPITILPVIDPSLPYQPSRDLRVVSMLYAEDGTIVVRPDLGVNTLAEFITLAKSKPGTLRFGSGGIGTIVHFAGELFAEKAGVKMLHVPYRGEQFGLTDLIGGHIDMYPLSTTVAKKMGEEGRLKILAVRGPERNPVLPAVPTLAEQGVVGADSAISTGLFVPAGVPDNIVAKLYAASNAAMKSPEVREKMSFVGARIVNQTTAQSADWVKADTDKWAQVVKDIHFVKQ